MRGLGAFFRRAVEYPFKRVSEQIAVAFLLQSRRFVFVGPGTDYDFSFIFARAEFKSYRSGNVGKRIGRRRVHGREDYFEHIGVVQNILRKADI